VSNDAGSIGSFRSGSMHGGRAQNGLHDNLPKPNPGLPI
jgi:hypothetical protein